MFICMNCFIYRNKKFLHSNHTEGLLVGLAEAAEAEDDGDHDQGGQHHVQHQVEVGALGQAANLNTVTLSGEKHFTAQYRRCRYIKKVF